MSQVKFLPGDGTDIMLDVSYIAGGFARDARGLCAFCHGDPCAEDGDATTPIAQYFERNRSWAETCPICDGRPS